MKYRYLLAALILAGLSSIASAQMYNQSGGNNAQGGSGSGNGVAGGGERPHGPPPQAIAACKGLASGAACTFQGRENKALSGTCFAPPGDNHPLACRPEHGGQNMGRQNRDGNQSGLQGGNQQ